MKFQCSCGAKYAIDIVPGMQPVQLVCQSCGQDYSAFINDLIRKELAQQGQQMAAPPAQPAAPYQAAPPPPPAAPQSPKLRISRAHEPAAPPSQEQAPVSKYCPRHRTEVATDHCQVCQKPICPKCMENFGPYCSPFCKNKVEGASMNAPVQIGSKFAAQREFWRKTGLISTVVGVILFCVFGFWFWYAWFGSQPGVLFSIRWDDISHSGTSRIVGGDQLVFLHGGTLARYNLKTKQKVWSLDLVTPDQIDAALKEQDEESTEEQHRTGHASAAVLQPGNIRQKYARIGLEQALTLHGTGEDIWIANGNALTHYDWDTGNVVQQIALTNNFENFTDHGDELLALGTADDGAQTVTTISLADGQTHTEEFFGASSSSATPVVVQNAPPAAAPAEGGLPLSRNDEGRAMNPRRVAEQAQNMSLPGRLALPALLANSEHNRQINEEMREEDQQEQGTPRARAAAPRPPTDFQNFTLIPDGDSYVAFSSQMTQENMVQRDAMRAPPKHSALDDANLSTANETAAVNEQLNEIQRNNGGGTVTEDDSTYQVAIRRPTSTAPDWTGQVIGSPQFFPLQTVNVLAAGKTVIVFDKTNKKLWQADLTYPVTAGGGETFQSQFGAGPCVENHGTLYVFDQAVLTAYDPTSGNVKWRIPSVGVVGLFFDDQGMVYVNTTTGNPDDIKYSRQIDVTKSTESIVLKVDPASGKILWSSHPGGYICYLSGKFIYTYNYFDPGDEEDQTSDALSALEKPAFLKVIRINPDNGHIMWEHDEGRAPVDIQFDRNTISLVLKKEVEVLHFFSL